MQLVADIGGTNARLARVGRSGDIAQLQSFKTADFTRPQDLFDAYVATVGGGAAVSLVVAVAGPVAGNVGRMTNTALVFDGAALAQRFGGPARVINDLTALGYAALDLGQDQLIAVTRAPAAPSPDRQALIVGIGTGFNVSCVVESGGVAYCPTAEAGHASLPSRVTRALDAIQSGLSSSFDTVESLFSGRGQRRFVSAVTAAGGPALAAAGPAQTASVEDALDAYAALIGHLLLDLRLAYMPDAGLFLAGGVARAALAGRRADIVGQIVNAPDPFLARPLPVWIIDDDAAALVGCRKLAQAFGPRRPR